jgi:hypothetical protein
MDDNGKKTSSYLHLHDYKDFYFINLFLNFLYLITSYK